MEEAIKFEVEDKDGNLVIAEIVLDSTKEVVELQMKGNKVVFSVDWVELQKVFTRALNMWETATEDLK